jgi:hypothetical protein
MCALQQSEAISPLCASQFRDGMGQNPMEVSKHRIENFY